MIKRIKDFLREVRVELSKVPRIKREELIGSTTVVLAVMFVVAVIVGILDTAIGGVLHWILGAAIAR